MVRTMQVVLKLICTFKDNDGAACSSGNMGCDDCNGVASAETE